MDVFPQTDPGSELARLLGDIVIPVRPQIIADLMKERARDEPDFLLIQRLIKADVSMSAAMLKAANSPLFGVRSRVTSVAQATQLLGLKHVLTVAMGVAMRQSLQGCDAVSLDRFWDSAEATATICARMAKQLRATDPDEAYSFGLFHDCGIPLLTRRFAHYKDVLRSANAASSMAFTDIEDQMIGTNHAVVGYFLARSWLFPEPLCEAINCHHDLETFTREDFKSPTARVLIALGHCAEHIQHLRRRGSEDMEWIKFAGLALDYLGIGRGEFEDICYEMSSAEG